MLKRYNVRLLKIKKLLFARTELQTIQDKAKILIEIPYPITFDEFWKTRNLLELDMREADHDIFQFFHWKNEDLENCVKMLSKFNISYITMILISLFCCLYRKIWINFRLSPCFQMVELEHIFIGINTTSYLPSVCLCVFVVSLLSLSSIRDRTGQTECNECKTDQDDFTNWMHFLSCKLDSNLEVLSAITYSIFLSC